MKSVWNGKAKATKKGLTKRSLMMTKDGKVIARKSVVGTKAQVFRGAKERTVGGLTQKDLVQNKRGKVVSKKAHSRGKKLVNKNGLAKWAKCVMKARKEMSIEGFVAVKKGIKLYKLAKQYYTE